MRLLSSSATHGVTSIAVILVCSLVLAACGESDSGSREGKADNSPREVESGGYPGVEVPDVTGEDGDVAVSDIEAEGLTASLEDQDGTQRDEGDGCTVEAQIRSGATRPLRETT